MINLKLRVKLRLDFLITSYSVATGSYEDRSFLRKLDCHYVILDEGHMLKNMHSQRYHCLMKMKVQLDIFGPFAPSKIPLKKTAILVDKQY